MDPEIVLLRAAALLIGVPAFLLGVFWLLDRLESWVLKPDERAAEVQALLAKVERADEVEEAVARLLAPVDSEMSASRGLLARARVRARVRARSRGTAEPGPYPERALPAPDAPASQRRQHALAEAQEALLEASAPAPAGPGGQDENQDPSGRAATSQGTPPELRIEDGGPAGDDGTVGRTANARQARGG